LISSKLSRRYAKALFSLGQEDGNFLQYGKELEQFSDFCYANREFLGVVANQIFSVAERKNVLNAILDKSAYSDLVNNFLRLLLEKNRIGAIAQVSDYYSNLTDESLNITRAEIVTARPLKSEAASKLAETLKNLTSKEVKTVMKQDESLIGGLIVKIGDLVLDGSVRAQLEGLKESLKRGEYN